MNDQEKTKQQLIAELADLRRRVADDTSDSKGSEVSLRASEDKYRRLYQSLMDAFVSVDMTGRIQEFNDAYCDMLGYEPEELLTKTYIEITPERWHAFQAKIIQDQVLRLGYSEIYQKEYRRKDGTIFPVELRTYLVADDHGKPVAMWAIIRDITARKQAETALMQAHDDLERKVDERTATLQETNERLQREIEERQRAEDALRESEGRYKTLVETSPNAIIMTDLEGRISFASQRTAQLHGSERVEELYGRHPNDFVAAEHQDRFAANMKKILEVGVLRDVEYELIRKDGARFVGELSCSLIHDSKMQPHAMMAIIQDITERKNTQEELKQSHDQLAAICEGMFDGLLVADIETKQFVRINHSLCRMIGYTEDELMSLSVMDIHPAADLPVVLGQFQAQADGRLPVAENVPVLRKDGSVFFADISTTPIDYHGRPCNLGVFHDITTRKEAEEALAREYRVLRRMLEAQDRERQLVAYEIHDGLVQQLTSAAMQFDAFKQLKMDNPQQASDCFSAGLHLLRESISETRRLIAGLRPPILDEAGIVAAISHLIHDAQTHDGPEVEFHSSVKSNRLEPLLENAIFRIVQEGVANVRRHSKSDRAEIRLVQDGNQVRVQIQDWGIGFKPDTVEERCFGLAGIRERARVLGGQATVDSTPGEGTRIVVELPLAGMSENIGGPEHP